MFNSKNYFRNDNSPRFDKRLYEVVVDSTTIPGTTVSKVSAEDPDPSQQGPLVYKLTSSIFSQNGRSDEFKNVFNVSQDNGEVTLVKSLRDFEGGCFEIKISAAEGSEIENEDHREKRNSEESGAETLVKIWVVDKKLHTIPILIHRNPIQLTSTQLKEYNK